MNDRDNLFIKHPAHAAMRAVGRTLAAARQVPDLTLTEIMDRPEGRLRLDLPYPAAILTDPAMHATMILFATQGEHIVAGARERGDARLASEVQVSWSLGMTHAMWASHGARIYDFPAPLVRAFMDTEFNMLGTDVSFPLPSFYLRCEGTGMKVCAWNEEGGMPLEGFYVMTTQGVDERLFERRAGTETKQVLHILAIGRDPQGRESENTFADFVLTLDNNLEETLARDVGRARQVAGQNADYFMSWLRIVLGACAYLSQEKPDVEARVLGPTATQKARAKTGSRGDRREAQKARLPVSYFRVGWREKLDAYYDDATTDEHRKLTTRFMVRGHFRQQAHGEGRKLRKTLWIKPHWKGPDWGELAAKIVKVRPD